MVRYNTLTKASTADNLQEVPALTECHFHSGGSIIPQLPAWKQEISYQAEKMKTLNVTIMTMFSFLLVFCLREWIQAFARLLSSPHCHWWRVAYVLLQQPPRLLSDLPKSHNVTEEGKRTLTFLFTIIHKS
jgi:hypothetical protein